MLGEVVIDQLPHFSRFRGMCVAVLGADPDHLVKIPLTPALRIAKRHDHHWSLFDLRLLVAGGAQLAALLDLAHHYEPPSLQIVAAGRAESRIADLRQMFICDR